MARRVPPSEQVIDAEFRSDDGQARALTYSQFQGQQQRQYSSFGYTGAGLEALQALWATLLGFAQATDAVGNQRGFPISMITIVNQLNFTNGTGARLAAQQMSWDAYAQQLQGAVDGIIGARMNMGMSTVDIGDWWGSVGYPQVTALGIAEQIGNTGAPVVKAAGDQLSVLWNAIPFWVKAIGIGAAVLVLLGQSAPFVAMLKSKAARRKLAGLVSGKRKSSSPRRIKAHWL